MEFWKIIPTFAQGKESYNSTMKFVNFIYSSGLGYCILRVAGRLLKDFEKKKKRREKEGAGDQNGKATSHFWFLVVT